MRVILRVLLWGVLGVAAIAGALVYFLYAPAPEDPHLTGQLTAGAITSGGQQRTYLTYVPRDLPPGAPLILVLHGSGMNGAHARVDSGYAFDRLADERGFAVVYPDAFEGYWNACNVVGDYEANSRDIDDVGFLTALADALAQGIGVDPARTYAAGVSRGGQMAFRLALEAPTRFPAVAAVAANVPAPENFKCRPGDEGTSSVMIMNGARDPLNPFEGGEVQLFGFYKRGSVRSSLRSAEYFASLNGLPVAPASRASADGVERSVWRGASPVEIELVAIQGGGHGIPQPYRRYPRLLGPTPLAPNGPAEIVAFFERHADT